MAEIFSKRGVPVVPSIGARVAAVRRALVERWYVRLGNNDIWREHRPSYLRDDYSRFTAAHVTLAFIYCITHCSTSTHRIFWLQVRRVVQSTRFPVARQFPGPNAITKEYADIWQSFIPFSSYQVFQRGAYFSTELILNSLAAVSLNTLYFYDSNKGKDGACTTGGSTMSHVDSCRGLHVQGRE